MVGTEGKAYHLENIQIQLNGEAVGTERKSPRLEELKLNLLKNSLYKNRFL